MIVLISPAQSSTVQQLLVHTAEERPVVTVCHLLSLNMPIGGKMNALGVSSWLLHAYAATNVIKQLMA